ncbi:MAG: ornithine cyclodeaminase family protein, partial [bacterium]
LIRKNHVIGELGEVLLDKISGRENDNDITVFKSSGIAVEDIIAAHHIYQKAIKEGIGIIFNFEGSRA